VQTQIWRTPFGVWALTRWRLGFHFFGDDLWEWLTLCPKTGPFAQISHTFGMVVSLSSRIEPHLYHKSGREANPLRPLGLTRGAGRTYDCLGAGMRIRIFPLFVLALLLFAFLSCARLPAPNALASGVAAAQGGDWDEAVRYWTAALERDPGSAAVHNNLAVAFEKRGAWDEARREYEAALRLDPANRTIRENFEAFEARTAARKGS
jgi:tetratricopeptide (TPR) repeat protein